MFRRFLYSLYSLGLLLAILAPACAQLAFVPGPAPGAARVGELLQRGGISYHRLAPAGVTASALAGLRTVVLARAPLTAEGAAALTQFAAGGGRLVLIGQEGPAELFRAVGVAAAPAQPVVRFEEIERATGEETAPGLPARLDDAVSPEVVLSPLPGTKVLAYRGLRGMEGPAAVTVGAGGAVISALFAPGGEWEKTWLLQAVLAVVDPALAEPAARGLHREAEEALAAAAAHWARVRDRAGLSEREAAERLRVLQALRAEWAGLGRSEGGMGQGGERVTGGRAAAEPRPGTPRSEGDGSGGTTGGWVGEVQGFMRRVRAFDLGLTPSRAGEIRGIWIHTYGPTDWERVAREVKAAGLNALFVRVGRGGNVIYPSALLPRDAWAEKAGGDEVQRAIEAAHRNGLLFYAWRVNFHMGSAPKWYRDRMASEDRLVRDSRGVQANYANPGDPRNTELEFQVMREMVEKYDIDGIQFDYIRYPDAPSFDYDYGAVSRRVFEKTLGRPVVTWPADVLSGPLKTAYEDWERENVNHLVERVYHEVKRLKPGVQVAASVWRNHRYYRALLKQDWPLWVQRHWLDLVVPMDYTPQPETFAATVDAQVALTRGQVPLAAGIGSWLLSTPEALAEQVEIARDAGAVGFVLFAYNAEQIEEQLAGLRAGATASDTTPTLVAPPLQISLASPAFAPKDAPLAVTEGTALKVAVVSRSTTEARRTTEGQGGKGGVDGGPAREPRDRWATAAPSVALRGPLCLRVTSETPSGGASGAIGQPGWTVQLESPAGAFLQPMVRASAAGVWTGVAPSGRFQPVVRGSWTVGGVERAFVVRGPVVEGLPEREMAALRARERPPVFDAGSGPRVGVYAGGLGAETVLAALRAQRVRAAAVSHLSPEHLAAVDVLLLPQLADVAELDLATQARLRRWVEGGRTLILTHDAIGARWHPRLFPELVKAVELGPATELVTEVGVGDEAAGSRLRHESSDQFRITPGPGARVLVRESPGAGAAPGAPVVVAGRVGRGTVILIGFLSGSSQIVIPPEETRLLAALARASLASPRAPE